jgi:hypothetical protein
MSSPPAACLLSCAIVACSSGDPSLLSLERGALQSGQGAALEGAGPAMPSAPVSSTVAALHEAGADGGALVPDSEGTGDAAAPMAPDSETAFDAAPSSQDGCAPFTFTPTIDGNLSDWIDGPAGTALEAFHGGTGYLAYDASNYYFACNMAPDSAGFAVTVYVGDGGTNSGGTTAVLPDDECNPSASALADGTNAKYAFTMDMNSGTVTAFAWDPASGSWAKTAFGGTGASAPDFELRVPKSDVGNITVPNVLGAVIQNAGVPGCSGANVAGAVDGWPGRDGIYIHFAAANTASCAVPNANIR